MRPFRFGLQTSNASDPQAWRDKARKAEDLGYVALYIPDHFTDQWGPLVALTVAAEATTTLQIGGLVFDNDYRHPVVLAKEIATLDLMSEGRALALFTFVDVLTPFSGDRDPLVEAVVDRLSAAGV